MTGVVISWADVTARYDELDKLKNATSPEVQDKLIQLAEADIHSRLASNYGVPFSSNNFTARDLCIDTVYVQNMMTRQIEKAKALKESLDKRIAALLSGEAVMIDSGGEIAVSMVGDTVYSSTMNYTPVFGMSDIAFAQVNSLQLNDEADARGQI